MNTSRLLLPALAILTLHCGDPSEYAKAGIDEPIRVKDAQFFQGVLPEATKEGPVVRSLTTNNNSVRAGQSDWSLGGDAQKGAAAVAMRFPDLGTGFWVLPLRQEDFSVSNGDLAWSTKIDFARDIPAGTHDIHIVAVLTDGSYGPLSRESVARVRVAPFLPDADVVLSLEWDTDADLDLHLIGPLETTAKELDPKHPTTGAIPPGTSDQTPLPPGTGVLDHDSNGRCVRDGYRRENVIWNSNEPSAGPLGLRNGLPLAGTYSILADMFDACGAGYANFKVTLYVHGEEQYARAGRLLSIDADGGGPGSGLFVGQIQLSF